MKKECNETNPKKCMSWGNTERGSFYAAKEPSGGFQEYLGSMQYASSSVKTGSSCTVLRDCLISVDTGLECGGVCNGTSLSCLATGGGRVGYVTAPVSTRYTSEPKRFVAVLDSGKGPLVIARGGNGGIGWLSQEKDLGNRSSFSSIASLQLLVSQSGINSSSLESRFFCL